MDRPARRPLRIFTFDPMVASTLERIGPGTATVAIPWEPLKPGPSGARVEVIDFDGGRTAHAGRQTDTFEFYEPVDLDVPEIAVQSGLAPSESDPRFHQQMVYAVAMRTLEAYDRSIGRRIRPYGGRLRLFPHAVRADQAYYHPGLRAVLFGYFEADRGDPGPNIPGQFVFTCLSHDIIVHEVTHALVHEMRPRLLDQTNVDVAAFHEAVGDLTAIFLHFTLPGVVESTIASTRTQLTNPTPLVELAQQFGQATGKGMALRSAIDVPDPRRYQTEMEPHKRGAILVAAVFEAFHTIYQRRIADLLRLATGGSGVLPAGSLHPDLVTRVSSEAIKTAEKVLTVCLRAFDYLPPVDVTYSDFLRAIVTSDRELYPTDAGGLRIAFIDAFRRRGIYPPEVLSLAESSLVWPGTDADIVLPRHLRAAILALDVLSLDLSVEIAGPSAAGTATERRTPAKARLDLKKEVEAFLMDFRSVLDLSASADIDVIGFQAMFRYDEDGAPHVNFVVQCVQQLTQTDAPLVPVHDLNAAIRRSVTVIFNESGRVRHIVAKPLPASDFEGPLKERAAERLARLNGWLSELVARDAGAPFGFDAGGPRGLRIDFAALHRRGR